MTTNLFIEFLRLMQVSINDGYLDENYLDEVYHRNPIVETASGYYALLSDTRETEDGNVWHTEQDEDRYGYDEHNREYRDMGELVYGYGRHGDEYHFTVNDAVRYRGDWYLEDYLSDNDLVRMDDDNIMHVDDVYYWDGDYHYDPEPDDDDDEDEEEELLWRYDSGIREKCFVEVDKETDGTQFGFGIEIEKSEMPDFYFNKHDVYDETGAVLERDGSVSNGFELKTPIYNLMSSKTDERIMALKPFCNIDGVTNAGGHVGFSMQGKTDEQLLDLCSGWLPLIFAMYKKRLSNHYCQGKNIDALKKSGEKFQAVRMRGNYIEFRLFSSVKTFKTLQFRIALFRIIAKNLGKTFNYIMTMALSEGTELNKLLRGDVYSDSDKFIRLMSDAIEMNKQFVGNRITSKSLTKIQNKLQCV